MPRATFAPLAIMLTLTLLTACGGGSSETAKDTAPTEDRPIEVPQEPASFIAADLGPGFDYVLGMDSHSDGSTSVVGYFSRHHTWDAGKDTETTFVGLGSYDSYIARYDAKGTLQWVQMVMGTDGVWIDEVAALSDGSCVVMGTLQELAILAPLQPEQQVIRAPGGYANFVARYAADGTLLWHRVIMGSQSSTRGKCVFPDDSVGFCGSIQSTDYWGVGEPGQTNLGSGPPTRTDFAARFTKDGDLVYAVPLSDATDYNFAYGIAALPDGSALVTVYFATSATFGTGTPQEQTFTATGIDDGYIVRLSPTGEQLWARHVAGAGREQPFSAAALPNGTVAIVGTFTGPTITFNQGEATAHTITGPSTGALDGNTFVCRYNAAGEVVWSTHLEHVAGAYLNLAGVTAFADNSIAIAGWGPGSVTADPGGPNETALPAFDQTDLLLAKFDSTGDLVWARRDGGVGFMDRGEGIEAYADGSLGFAGGYRDEFTVNHGGPGQTTYAGSVGNTDSLLIRYNADGSHDGK